MGFLEFFAKFALLRLGQVGNHIFLLVPLASLNQGLLAKHLSNSLAQPLGAINDEQKLVVV